MTEIARRNTVNTALVERRLNKQRILQIVKETVGPTLGPISTAWSDQQLFDAELVKVTAVAQPTPSYGEHVEEVFAGELVANVWHEKWNIVADDTVANLKEKAKDRAATMVRDKISAVVARRGIESFILDAMTYIDLNAAHADGLGFADHPLLNAFKVKNGLTNPEVDAAIITQRKTQFQKGSDWIIAQATADIAIDAATTRAQIGAALDTLAAALA